MIHVVLLCAALLCGCATNASAPWADLGRDVAPATPRLVAGDELKITVFDEDNLSGTFEVSPAGNISMPLVGIIPAAGLTVDQFREALNRRLADGYIKNPRTAVEVTSYTPIFVHGEVRNGGKFAFENGLTFRDAIALAGGYTYRADEGYVLLKRRGARDLVRVALPSQALLKPGDNIRVPERFF